MVTMKKLILGLTGAAMVFGFALTAQAIDNPEHYSLFGDAAYITPGNASDRAVHIESDATGVNGYGGISYGVEDGTTFADLTTLSSDFRIEADDTCVGGSPRVSIGIDTTGDGVRDGSIFAYFGTDSGGVACTPGTWQSTGDFLETGRLLDTSQLGGTFYDTYADALADYGAFEVTSISIVTDSSWAAADSEHAADIDNTLINATLFTYEVPPPPVATTKDQCKKGGWEAFGFKNQGQCVASIVSQSENH